MLSGVLYLSVNAQLQAELAENFAEAIHIEFKVSFCFLMTTYFIPKFFSGKDL